MRLSAYRDSAWRKVAFGRVTDARGFVLRAVEALDRAELPPDTSTRVTEALTAADAALLGALVAPYMEDEHE